MVDGAASLTSMLHGMLAAGQWVDARRANVIDGGRPYYDTYACADGGHMAVGCLEPQFYDLFVELLTAIGTFCAALTAFVSVGVIVLREEPHIAWTVLILIGWAAAGMMLKGLTAQRLAALNHGTFRSPIPGREAQDVLRKCRDWASEIGEIKITEDQNPIISIQVTGVDIEPILRAAEANDNAGNRRKRIREALFKELEINHLASFQSHCPESLPRVTAPTPLPSCLMSPSSAPKD